MEDPKILVIYTLIGIPFVILALVFALMKSRNIAPIANLIVQISAWMILMGGFCFFLVRCFFVGFGLQLIPVCLNLFFTFIIWALLIVISNTTGMIQEIHDSWRENRQNLSL